jgi:glucosamine--fructose-6-phosphate aminotransferase (isomerizing)
MEQPNTWKDVLAALAGQRNELQEWLRNEKFGQVILVGCGASYHAGVCAARVFHSVAGLNAIALPSSEVLYSSRPPYDIRIKTLLVALSRSGETSETVWAVEKLKSLDARLKVMAMVFKKDTELAQQAHLVLAFPSVHEESVLATRTFTCSVLALEVLAAWIAGNDPFVEELNRLPETFNLKKHQAEIQKAVALKPQHITFLGSGPFYGLALFSSLLMREMAYQPSDAMHLLEFRHGAQSSVLQHTLIIAFLSDTLRRAEEDMIREVAAMRGPRMVICSEADNRTKMGTEYVFELGKEVSELGRLCLAAPFGQMLAFYLAISKGANPDRPKHVTPVIKLKERM